MTYDEKRATIAQERAQRLIHGNIVIAARKTPHCCLCHKKIDKGKPYYRLSGGLCGHKPCVDYFVENRLIESAHTRRD